MKPVVGVFKSRAAATQAAAKLVPLGIPQSQVQILTPASSSRQPSASL